MRSEFIMRKVTEGELFSSLATDVTGGLLAPPVRLPA